MTPWQITYNDHTWTDEDVALAHVAVVSTLLGGDSWEDAEPWGGPQRLGAWITVLESAATGRPMEDVMVEVQRLSHVALAGMLTRREVVRVA